MVHRSMAVTATPTALPGTMSGETYRVQNRSESATVNVSLATSAPDATTANCEILRFRRSETFKPAAGESIFVWTSYAGGALVAYVPT